MLRVGRGDGRLALPQANCDAAWAAAAADALTDDEGMPKLLARSWQKGGKPSNIDHGNGTPTIEAKAGAITLHGGV